ncbi:hypothetical protein M3Y97_00997500 [Aphelenchoides bicaudatus]|nr:hypothetical protein M3Y97_00997500 [Aphelenchoides bicaudatus]
MLLLLEPKHVRVRINRHFNLNKCAMLVATLKHVKCLISIESKSRKVNCSLLVNVLASNLRQITCSGADIVESTPLSLDFCKLAEPLDDEEFNIIARRHTIKCLEFERGRENFWIDPGTPASSRPQITSVKTIFTNCVEIGDANAFLQMLASNNVRLAELNIRIFNKPIWKATKFNILVKKIREQCKNYFDLNEIAGRVAFKTRFYFCLQVILEFAELTRNTWLGNLTQIDLFKNCRYHNCGNRYLFELPVEKENIELKIQLLVVS